MPSQGKSISETRIANAIARSLSQTKYKRNQSLVGKRNSAAPTMRKLKKQGKIEGVINGVATGGPDGPERKKQDLYQTNTAVGATAPFITSLYYNISQGTQSNQRVGDRITIKSVDFEANVTQYSGTGTSFIDVFLVWDKEPGGTITSASQIFSASNTNLTFTAVGQTDRFVILRREQIAMDSSNLAKSIKWHQPCDLGVKYLDAAGYPQSNDLLIVALCPGTVGGASGTNINFICRSSYIDA